MIVGKPVYPVLGACQACHSSFVEPPVTLPTHDNVQINGCLREGGEKGRNGVREKRGGEGQEEGERGGKAEGRRHHLYYWG
jgi:hypothetical protein